jgi:hypothetical protein
MVQKSLLHQQINPDPKKKRTSGLLGDGSSDTWGWERAVGPIKNYFFLLVMDFFDWSIKPQENPL